MPRFLLMKTKFAIDASAAWISSTLTQTSMPAPTVSNVLSTSISQTSTRTVPLPKFPTKDVTNRAPLKRLITRTAVPSGKAYASLAIQSSAPMTTCSLREFGANWNAGIFASPLPLPLSLIATILELTRVSAARPLTIKSKTISKVSDIRSPKPESIVAKRVPCTMAV